MDPVAALLDEVQLPQRRVQSVAVDVGQVGVGGEVDLTSVVGKGQPPTSTGAGWPRSSRTRVIKPVISIWRARGASVVAISAKMSLISTGS